MVKQILRYGGIGCSIFFLLLLVFNPAAASDAVKTALSICSGIILPSLLPFFFISGIISALGIPEILARVFGKAIATVFSVSPYGAAPLFLGLLGGYPVGAVSLAELVKNGSLSAGEAERLLPLCNNTGPAFIIGAVGGGIFSSVPLGIMLYIVHILAAFSVGLLFRPRKARSALIRAEVLPDYFSGLASALPQSIKSSVEKSLSICGFVIFFSILAALLEEMSLLSSAALFLSGTLGLDIGFCRSLVLGTMELGGGIASMKGLPSVSANHALAAFILGFGSLSVHCQTLAVVSETNIKCARHFAGRILHGALSALYAYVLSFLFRI